MIGISGLAAFRVWCVLLSLVSIGGAEEEEEEAVDKEQRLVKPGVLFLRDACSHCFCGFYNRLLLLSSRELETLKVTSLLACAIV